MSITYGYGECPECLEVIPLNVDGRLRRHPHGVSEFYRCIGTWELPKPHVHRCPCGACWDEDTDLKVPGDLVAPAADVSEMMEHHRRMMTFDGDYSTSPAVAAALDGAGP